MTAEQVGQQGRLKSAPLWHAGLSTGCEETTACLASGDEWTVLDKLLRSGAGVVHCAPAFGEDDYRVCLAGGIITKASGFSAQQALRLVHDRENYEVYGVHSLEVHELVEGDRSCLQALEVFITQQGVLFVIYIGLFMQGGDFPIAVDDDGRFTEKVADFKGRYVKLADKDIVQAVKVSLPRLQGCAMLYAGKTLFQVYRPMFVLERPRSVSQKLRRSLMVIPS